MITIPHPSQSSLIVAVAMIVLLGVIWTIYSLSTKSTEKEVKDEDKSNKR